MDKGGIVLERLHEIRLQRLLEQHRHRALGAKISGSDRREISRVADHDIAEAALQVDEALRQANDRHDLGGHHDVEPVLAREAVGGTPEADRDAAERAVVHVDDALPGNPPNVESEFVAVVNMVVDECRKQVMRKANGSEIAREVQIDIFHRHHLRIPPARRPALQPEDGTQAGFTQADDRFLADLVERITKPDRRGGLALAGRSGAQGRYQNQLAVGPAFQALNIVERDFGLVTAVVLDALGRDAEAGGDVADGFQDRFAGNLDV